MFGLKRNLVTGGWRKLRNEGLHNLYSSPNNNRMISKGRWDGWMDGACSMHGGDDIYVQNFGWRM
jgi:hypothetical protein